MIGTLIILAILTTGLTITMFYPVLLPSVITDAITSVLVPIGAFEGLLPVRAIFTCLNWTMSILIAYIVFKIVMGLIAMVTGGSQPDIE